jgi:hypothetical protein
MTPSDSPDDSPVPPPKINLFLRVTGSPDDPVSTWPYEGMVSVIERGNILDWRPLIRHLREDPWGPVSKKLERYLAYAEEEDVVAFFRLVILSAREKAEAKEREEVSRRVRQAKGKSGLTSTEFAARIGTSASRFSTYLNGLVMPSAALLFRMENISSLPHHTPRQAPASSG